MVIMIRLMIPSRHPPRSKMMMMRAMKLKRWRWKMVIMIICWPLTSGVDHDFSGDVDFLLATLPGLWWWWGRWWWKDEDNDLINGDQGDYDYPGVNNDVSDEVLLMEHRQLGQRRKILFWPQLTIVPDCLSLALCHTLSHLLLVACLLHFVVLGCHLLFVTFCCAGLSHLLWTSLSGTGRKQTFWSHCNCGNWETQACYNEFEVFSWSGVTKKVGIALLPSPKRSCVYRMKKM